MELSDVLPLLGVLLGWLLKELSDSLRGRAETRARLGTALVEMLQLAMELRRLRLALTFQKNRPISWEEYEVIREETARRYFTRTDPLKAVSKAVAVLGRRNPLAAAQLAEVPHMFRMFGSVSLEPLSKKAEQEDYIKILSVLEVGIDLAEDQLRQLIQKLARAHSVVTWWRVHLMWLRLSEGNTSKKNHALLESLLAIIYVDAAPGKESVSTQPTAAETRENRTHQDADPIPNSSGHPSSHSQS